MSVLSPLNSPPATDTQQAVSEESIEFFFRKTSVHGKQQKCLIVFA